MSGQLEVHTAKCNDLLLFEVNARNTSRTLGDGVGWSLAYESFTSYWPFIYIFGEIMYTGILSRCSLDSKY